MLDSGDYVFTTAHSSLNALPAITQPLTIRGNGTTLRRTGAAKYRFIHVNGVMVILDGLTFADGDIGTDGWGGAVLNEGTLTVTNSTFTNNRAGTTSGQNYGGAIANRGTLTVTDSTFTGNFSMGGAILSGARNKLIVTGSIFTDNETSGIYFYSEATSWSVPESRIYQNCFVGNQWGLVRSTTSIGGYTPPSVSVFGNWWGASDGPTADANYPVGYGEVISGVYDYEFLTAPPAGCDSLPPVVSDEALIGVTGRERVITLDPHGGLPPYSYSIDTAPEHGTLTGSTPNLVYTSDAGYLGADSLTYTVSNASGGGSTTATISLTIQQALTAGRSFSTERNVEIAIPLASDDGLPPFTFSELVQPEHGYVGRTGTHFYYFPDLDYVGADSFSYRISDGLGDTFIETVSIDVLPRTPATITVDTTVTENSPFVVNGNCTIGEALRASATNLPVDACPAGTTGIDIIDLPEGTFTRLTDTSWGELPDKIILRGAGIGKTVLTADPTVHSGILRASGGTRTIQELTIRGGLANCCNQNLGGGLYIYAANTTIRLVHFDSNRAASGGGGIYSYSSSLYIVGSVFTGNDSFNGGGMRTDSQTSVTILHSAFEDNIASFDRQAFVSSGPIKVHLSCLLDVMSYNPNLADLSYNWGAGSSTLATRPPICAAVMPVVPPFLRIRVAAGDTAGLIAAIEQVNAFGTGEVSLAAGEYVLTEPYLTDPSYDAVGLPPITADVDIVSSSRAIIRRDSAVPFRFLTVDGGDLMLNRITLINGLADTAAAIHIGGGGSLLSAANRYENNTSTLGGAVILVADGRISSSADVYIGNTGGTHVEAGSTGSMRSGCYLYNTGTVITNDAANPVLDGTYNWWDSVDGPSGAGSGHGEAVGANVNFSNFRTALPTNCPTGRVHVFDQSAEMLAFDGSINLTLVATGGDNTYTIVTGTPSHGTLTGIGAARTYTPDVGFIGDDTFTVTATDGAGLTDTGTFTVTVRLNEITVDSTAQEVPFVTNGNCTLGEAIQAANTDSAVDGCAAGNGRDTIVLETGAVYTLSAVSNTTLNATGLPLIGSDIAIDGNGATIIREPSAPEFRLIAVDLNGILRIDSVTLTGGYLSATSGPNIGGGALFVKGTLDAVNLTVSSNYSTIGGGIRIGGSSTIRDSTFTSNAATRTGGGAYVCGYDAWSMSNHFVDTDFIGNTALLGGGAVHYRCAPVTMTGGRIANNTSPVKGASVYAEPYLSSHTTTLTGVVIEENVGAEGSVYAVGGVRLNISGSCILEDTPTIGIISTAVSGQITIIASDNWWGSSTGTQYGTRVSGHLTVAPHLTAPILDCPINSPSAVDMTLYTAYQTPVAFTLTGVDGMSPYTFAVELPAHGTLTGTAPDLVYTPDEGYSGTDSFTFTTTDSLGLSDTATVTLNVATDLSAQPAFFEMAYNWSVNIRITPLGGRTPYTLSLVSQPQYGTLTHEQGIFTYMPPTDFTGTDTASVRITDANGDTYDSVFNIAVGQRVTAIDQLFDIVSGGAVTFRLWAMGGTPGNSLMPTATPNGSGYNYDYNFSELSEPLNGRLYSEDEINWTYIADAGFIGYETLTFTVTDAFGLTDEGVITIVIGNPPTNTPTFTPSYTPTATYTPTETHTPSLTPTQTFTPSNTPTETFTPSLTPTQTFTPSNTPTETFTPSLTPTQTFTPSNTPTQTPSAPVGPPSIPQAISPLGSVILAELSPTLVWQRHHETEYIQRYNIRVFDGQGNIVIRQNVPYTMCRIEACSWSIPLTLPNGSYTWVVRAKNSLGQVKGSANSFSVQWPGGPVLLEPIGGIEITNRRPVFIWQQVPQASEYRLTVTQNGVNVINRWFAAPNYCDGVTCSVYFADLASGVRLGFGDVKWHVRAANRQVAPNVSKSINGRFRVVRGE